MVGALTVPVRDRIRLLIERWVPWYDHDAEARMAAAARLQIEASRASRARATATIARSENDRIRRAYRAYGREFHR